MVIDANVKAPAPRLATGGDDPQRRRFTAPHIPPRRPPPPARVARPDVRVGGGALTARDAGDRARGARALGEGVENIGPMCRLRDRLRPPRAAPRPPPRDAPPARNPGGLHRHSQLTAR